MRRSAVRWSPRTRLTLLAVGAALAIVVGLASTGAPVAEASAGWSVVDAPNPPRSR
jgi:hypothetical protein